MMQTIDLPTNFIREPFFDGCQHSVRFGSRYPFPCFVLAEESSDGGRTTREDLRLYPLTAEGRKTAEADLAAIEEHADFLRREKAKELMRSEIAKRKCAYCRFYPEHPTDIRGVGKFEVCRLPRRTDDEDTFTIGGVPMDRIIRFKQEETCQLFELADKFKTIER